jgi:hypothetical protein
MIRKIAIGLAAAAIATTGSTLSASAIHGVGGIESAIHGAGEGDGGGGAYFDVVRYGGGGYGSYGRGGYGRGGYGRGGYGRGGYGRGGYGRGGYGHRY